MVEILVGFGILVLMFSGVIMIYRAAVSSFTDGEWHMSRQKAAQILLNAVREDFEKANSPTRVRADGTFSNYNGVPIYLAAAAVNDTPGGTNALAFGANGARVPVAFCSLSTPYVEVTPFVPVASPGLWLGCGLGFQGRTLVYRRTGDTNLHANDPAPLPGTVMTFPATGVGPGRDFLPNPERNLRIEVSDVESVAFYRTTTTTEQACEIRIRMARRQGTRVWADFVEKTSARTLSVTVTQTF